MTTSPIMVRPDVLSMSRKPLMTLTTITTRATHSATAATAIHGMIRLVR